MGNFSTPILNHYLHHHTTHGYINPLTTPVQPGGIHIALGTTRAQFLHLLPTNTTRILLHGNSKGYGHATCIKLINNNWYLLDSEFRGPINLDNGTDYTWEHLQGTCYHLTLDLPRDFHSHGFDSYHPIPTHLTIDLTNTSPHPPPPRARAIDHRSSSRAGSETTMWATTAS